MLGFGPAGSRFDAKAVNLLKIYDDTSSQKDMVRRFDARVITTT
jgi:hypothetical protein